MMKLILSLTLIWALCSTAEALVCQTCTDQHCSSTVPRTCPSGTMCVTASSQVFSSGTTVRQILKSCAQSSLCPTTGKQTFSMNLGVSHEVMSAYCCNTDNCNSATLPFPGSQSDNSLQCFSCNSAVDTECTTPTQCRGVEDRCFKVTVTDGTDSVSASGCVSRNLCAAPANMKNLLTMQKTREVTTETSCCETNLCNSVTTITASSGIIHLLLGLLVFTFY